MPANGRWDLIRHLKVNVSESSVCVLAVVQVLRSCKPVWGFNFILVSNFHIAQLLEAQCLHIIFLYFSFTYGRSFPNFRSRFAEVPYIKCAWLPCPVSQYFINQLRLSIRNPGVFLNVCTHAVKTQLLNVRHCVSIDTAAFFLYEFTYRIVKAVRTVRKSAAQNYSGADFTVLMPCVHLAKHYLCGICICTVCTPEVQTGFGWF